jgi:putative Mn2+ efflux pump MntP
VWIVAVSFGGSHVLMPLIGWGIGTSVGPLIEAFDHWIAFALLAAIGIKMLWEARGGAREGARGASDPFDPRTIALLAIAVSIDALAVGITLPLVDAPFVTSLATIGVTTALLSVVGLFAGRRFGGVFGRRLDVLGGIVLIGIGAKILVEHLRAA